MGASQIARIVIALGIVSIFAVALYGNSAPGLPSVVFPTFANPFASQYVSSLVSATGNAIISKHTNAFGCSNASYWQCVATNDGDTSYVNLTGGFTEGTNPAIGHYINVNHTQLSNGDVLSVVIVVWCRTVGNATVTDNFHIDGGVERGAAAIGNCPVSNTYVPVRVAIHQLPVVWRLSDFNNASFGITAAFGNTGVIRVTYMEMEVTQNTGPAVQCGGTFFTNMACQMAAFLTTFVKAVQFIVNGIIFVVSWIIAGATFLGGLLAIVLWLFNIPGMPTFIQIFLDVFLTAMIATLFFNIAKMIRGSSP